MIFLFVIKFISFNKSRNPGRNLLTSVINNNFDWPSTFCNYNSCCLKKFSRIELIILNAISIISFVFNLHYLALVGELCSGNSKNFRILQHFDTERHRSFSRRLWQKVDCPRQLIIHKNLWSFVSRSPKLESVSVLKSLLLTMIDQNSLHDSLISHAYSTVCLLFSKSLRSYDLISVLMYY